MQLVLFLLLAFYMQSLCSAEELLELSCSSDTQCAKYEGGKCQELRCVCTARDSKERIDCEPKDEKVSNIIGGPCPCTQPHTECDAQVQQCFCVDGYIPSKDKRRCVQQKVPLNGTCEMSRQCQLTDTFAVCQKSQQRCICMDHYELYKGHCLALLDVSCNTNSSYCESIGALICLPHVLKCACPIDSAPNQNLTACVPGVDYEANCTTAAQCQLRLGAESTCRENRCTCRFKNYARKDETLNRTVCEPHVQYGAYCRRTEDCQEVNEGGDMVLSSRMQCDYGECRCRAGFALEGNAYCVAGGATTNQLYRFLPLTIPFIWLIYSR